MDGSLLLLFPLLQFLSTGAAVPLPADVVTMTSKVKWMAEQLLVRLNKDFKVPLGLTLSPPVNDLDGLSSVVAVLDGYNSVISDALDGVSQIKYDISSLTGYLGQWGQRHCSEQSPKPPLPRALQELQRQKEFIDTVGLEALMRVKAFLNLLLKNLDTLKNC